MEESQHSDREFLFPVSNGPLFCAGDCDSDTVCNICPSCDGTCPDRDQCLICNGIEDERPREKVLQPMSLQHLAAKVLGSGLTPGVMRGLHLLEALPFPKMLIDIIYPFLVMSKSEWQLFSSRERYWSSTDPCGGRIKKIIFYYEQMYPDVVHGIIE
jgi:hypothetical protein